MIRSFYSVLRTLEKASSFPALWPIFVRFYSAIHDAAFVMLIKQIIASHQSPSRLSIRHCLFPALCLLGAQYYVVTSANCQHLTA